jgi:hypothetical protein
MTRPSLEDELEDLKLRQVESSIESLQWRCFHLERKVAHLKYVPKKTKSEKRDFRMKRMALRHELAMLRIDAESLVEEAAPVLGT